MQTCTVYLLYFYAHTDSKATNSDAHTSHARSPSHCRVLQLTIEPVGAKLYHSIGVSEVFFSARSSTGPASCDFNESVTSICKVSSNLLLMAQCVSGEAAAITSGVVRDKGLEMVTESVVGVVSSLRASGFVNSIKLFDYCQFELRINLSTHELIFSILPVHAQIN